MAGAATPGSPNAVPLYNFVIDATAAEIESYAAAPGLAALIDRQPELLASLSSKGSLCWCLQTYLVLKQRNRVLVNCSNRIEPGAINLIHSDHLLNLRGSGAEFLVCVRADFPRRRWAHFHLVQNRAQLGPDTAYLPLWLQPRLIGRDPRRQGVTTIAYAGEIVNGNLAGSVADWRRRFAQHDLLFAQPPSSAWHDLSGIDVLIGVRSFDTRPYNGKPPSKLLNAWQAGIPFVGGYDSAFAQVGTPGRDYLRAGSLDEVIAAVCRLRDDPVLYETLVSNGRRLAAAYAEDNLAAAWEEALAGVVLRRYRRWRAAPALERARFDFTLNAGLFEHGSRQVIKRAIRAF